MKQCSKCKTEYELDSFPKDSSKHDGLHSHCKACRKQTYLSRPQKTKAKALESCRRYRENNLEKCRQMVRDHYQNNKEYYSDRWAVRKAQKLQAMPILDEELSFVLSEVYSLARLRTDITGFEWHVDHIVPLNNANVCGLHTPHNLQVIPAKLNLSKSNSFYI